MTPIISKSWQYILSEQEGRLFLSVVCGTVAIYTITFELSVEEQQNYLSKGEAYIDELAALVINQPQNFMPRNMPDAEEEI